MASEPLESLPVVRHFYPINPHTALQQQSAVYNPTDYPLVAPILSTSQPMREADSQNNKKRKIQEVDAEAHLRMPGRSSRTAKESKQSRLEISTDPSESFTICLCPQQPRRIAYVELPGYGSIDRTLYCPLDETSPATQALLGQGREYYREPSFTSTSSGESTTSEYVDPTSSILTEPRRRNATRRIAENGTEANGLLIFEDEATTCHQCRRKTTKEKMRCRRHRSNGSPCPFLFCQTCIEVRYDENFDSFNDTWLCPRCRGICNCSICLRKAGFGYILDGPMSERLTGTQGRLSASGQTKKQSRRGGVRVGNKPDDEHPRVSVQAWLARKGIALGTEEWMMERRRQGVRFVVGKSLPLPHVLSLYKEAQFNPTLAACTEHFEDDEVEELSGKNDADVSVAIPPPALSDSATTALSPTQGAEKKTPPLPVDVRPTSSALEDMNTAETHRKSGSDKLPFLLPDASPSTASIPGEDLPGLSSTLTHGLRLIIGKPFPRKNRQQTNLKAKGKKVIKPTRNTEVSCSDSDNDELKTGFHVIRVGGCGLSDDSPQIEAIQDDEKEEEKDFASGSSTPVSDIFPSPLLADGLSVPSPPEPAPLEPVLVPTEYYAPSKLDATLANVSQRQLGHTYWALNTVIPHQPEPEHNTGHSHRPSSLLMSTPLYSNDDQNPYSHFSLDDVSHVGPSDTASTSTPMSRDGAHPSSLTPLPRSRTPNDYLKSQTYTQDDAYSTDGLAAFTMLDETWATADTVFPSLQMDMSPLYLEGMQPVIAP